MLLESLEVNARDDAPYLVFHGSGGRERWGARAALEAAWCWGGALRRAGVRPGDRVPILLPTSPDFVGAFFGAQLAGATPVPLPTPLGFGRLDRTMERLERIVTDADADVLVTSGRYAGAAAQSEALRARVRRTIEPAQVSSTPSITIWPSVDPEALALLQYTSGTSGVPKGVGISHRALVANTASIAHALALEPADVGVSWLPIFHDMGLVGGLLTPVTSPFEVHVLPPEAFLVRPRRWLQLLTDVGATVSPAPNFAYELCTRRVEGLEALGLEGWRAALNGAEMVHASTLDRFTARFGRVGFRADAFTPVYGLAESTLAVCAPTLGREPTRARFDTAALERGEAVASSAGRSFVSVGQPVAGAEVRIADGARALEDGRVGEIQTRGPSVMRGYFRQPEATAASFVDGWLRTGDLGFSFRGDLFVKGRAKDVVVQGGRNVYPEDVEQAALEGPEPCGAAAAFGVEDAAAGTERLVLVVEVRGGGERDALARRIRGRVLDALGVGVDEIALWPLGRVPRTTSGKVRRAACRRAWQERS